MSIKTRGLSGRGEIAGTRGSDTARPALATALATAHGGRTARILCLLTWVDNDSTSKGGGATGVGGGDDTVSDSGLRETSQRLLCHRSR